MKYYLIDMKKFSIIGEFVSEEDANAAFEKAPSPAHLANDTWESLGSADLVRIFNALPSTHTPVNRFADKKSAVARLNKALAGEVDPAPKAELWDVPEPEPKPTKEKTVKRKTKPVPHAVRRSDSPTDVTLAAAGKKEGIRFVEGSPRSKVFEVIKKAGTISIDALAKRCPFVNRAQLLGCLQKLQAKSYVKVS